MSSGSVLVFAQIKISCTMAVSLETPQHYGSFTGNSAVAAAAALTGAACSRRVVLWVGYLCGMLISLQLLFSAGVACAGAGDLRANVHIQ